MLAEILWAASGAANQTAGNLSDKIARRCDWRAVRCEPFFVNHMHFRNKHAHLFMHTLRAWMHVSGWCVLHIYVCMCVLERMQCVLSVLGNMCLRVCMYARNC
jgi:hypothetical protein